MNLPFPNKKTHHFETKHKQEEEEESKMLA